MSRLVESFDFILAYPLSFSRSFYIRTCIIYQDELVVICMVPYLPTFCLMFLIHLFLHYTVNSRLADTPLLQTFAITDKIQIPSRRGQNGLLRTLAVTNTKWRPEGVCCNDSCSTGVVQNFWRSSGKVQLIEKVAHILDQH